MLHLYKLIYAQIEHCFNVQISSKLTEKEYVLLCELLAHGFDINTISKKPFLDISESKGVEIGPLMNFDTQFSSQVVSICKNIGLNKIVRIEKSVRYLGNVDLLVKNHCISTIQTIYDEPLKSFESGRKVESVKHIQLIEQGIEAFDDIEGLSFSKNDKLFYYDLFVNNYKRNPTDVELFDLLNFNCEHSRHGIFNAKIIIDGNELKKTLFDLVKTTLAKNPDNSVIGFHDNSSAISGAKVITLVPNKPGFPSGFKYKLVNYNVTLTAETHNFPTGIDANGGAETGAGGRIRDGMATGKGSYIIAAGASYSVASLQIPGYKIPGETVGFCSPSNMVQPLDILIKASNSASSYCNEFGEPCITGSVYSFDLVLPNSERWAYVKPIMFTSGIGSIRDKLIKKDEPQTGMLIVQIGGAARRIGFGGGAASSLHQGENSAVLDFNAVQRGDAETQNKVYKVVKTCNDMEELSPIASIHDQGAAGIANVLKELVKDIGGIINIRLVNSADSSLSVLEIWVCEYQERIGFLIYPEKIDEFSALCKREKVSCEILGFVTGDGRFIVEDSSDGTTPVDFDLKSINADFPQATYSDKSVDLCLEPFVLASELTVEDSLRDIFKLVQVGCKSWLTNKVDRSVTGLIVQQQCVGPLHLPLANNGVVALSHFELKGAVTARGEKPICMLVNPAAGARMAIGEMLTNIIWVGGVNLKHIKCSTNWMWAPKKPGELVALTEACISMTDVMLEIGIASDGGKDSFSMATDVNGELVKSPRTLVVSGYCDIPDITKVITPDIKKPGESRIIYIDISKGKARFGGSALAQANYQIGNESPDMDDPNYFVNVFETVQKLISDDLILAGHDISDGGLITSICEMAFAGNCGIQILMEGEEKAINKLFAEELGLLIEVSNENIESISSILEIFGIEYYNIGNTTEVKKIGLVYNYELVIYESTDELRSWWSETSYQLEKLQSNPDCAEMERKLCYELENPVMKLSFTPYHTQSNIINSNNRIKVAVLREEGSNGESEMKSALYLAGFDPYDVCMKDLLDDSITLDEFQGIIAVGGFSYGDYPSSAKGWAITIRSNAKLKKMFDDFKNREDTFSFGVCNGCQMLSLLGWVSLAGYPENEQARFIENESGTDASRSFESRYVSLRVEKSNSIMFKNMEGSIIPIWSAHGEGRLTASDNVIKNLITLDNVPVYYATSDGDYAAPEHYPFNPNGSPYGIAGLCSSDGRHTIMMPHPERLFQIWQFPWLPKEFQNMETSPWLKIFQNAREWCENINKNK